MESLLNQIYKSPFLSYFFLAISGAVSVFAFSPFDIKILIVFPLAILAHSMHTSQSIGIAIKRAYVWGLGLWLGGTGWLIVSIYYYGNTGITISIFIVLIMGMLLSLFFIAPIAVLKSLNLELTIFQNSLLFASIFTLLELSRFYLLGGFPWLLPGLVFMDTIGANLIPIIGVYGCSFILYFFASIVGSLFVLKNIKLLMLSILMFLVFLPFPPSNNQTLDDGLKVSIVQPSLDPFSKYENDSVNNIEEVLVELSKKYANSDLIVWPESPFPYLNSSPQMESLHNRTKHLPTILSGSWLYKDNNLHNTMTILGTKQHYIKRHLVPFGEYVPFESILRGLIEFFDMPMSSLQEGPNHQPYFNLNNFKILGLICFDIAFPLSFRSEIKNADFIINISNDTWFGNSYGPYQHLQIVRARALESNKWIARGTSDGISTIVDNKGTIVDLLPKNARDTLYGTIFRTNNSTFFFNYGYLLAPLMSLILLVSFFIIRYRK